MEAVKETKYDKGVLLLACGARGKCPLEADCEYWDLEAQRCGWPDEKKANLDNPE